MVISLAVGTVRAWNDGMIHSTVKWLNHRKVSSFFTVDLGMT